MGSDPELHALPGAFDEDRAAMLERARQAGVEAIVTVGCDVEDSRRASGFEISSWTSSCESKPYDLPPSALEGDLPRKESPEGLGSVTIVSDEAATPTAHDGKPIL